MQPNDLPDRVHILALREALWRPESRAGVLIGAGMSRNAIKLSPAVKDFPLWWEIASRLQSALSLSSHSNDALRLGQMYENTYGRARLDDLLLEVIPDGKYEPGPLHERLLRLPWADVFTTNYDTLLERTARRIGERKYDIVETPQDLTRAERPRIVKLHGSFPARRPFIFTAEDYRRYPTDFAPFINLVRQSAMENVLCLVGFSGDDPNFLQWAGWVRDQLGSTAPKMYLCGVLDLTTPARTYYQHMQVIPVDLGPLFPAEVFGQAERYSMSIAWFIESLHAGEPLDLGRWPNPRAPARTKQLPAPCPDPLPSPDVSSIIRAPEVPKPDQKLDAGTLKDLLASWRSERMCYPGWAVCPEYARFPLWYQSGAWLWHLAQPSSISLLNSLPAPERAAALREITWRTETCLVPLAGEFRILCEQVLEEFNPRPALINVREAIFTPEADTHSRKWDELTETWVSLAFALVRHAWQSQDADLHNRWMERLNGIMKARPLWQARWWYEKCWHHLIRLEMKEVQEAVRHWPSDISLPFWEAKRAAVLGELGQIDEAVTVATDALERVRLGRERSRIDHQTLSEEGWIEGLRQILAGYAWKPFGFGHEERERRLRELSRDRCNPWDDLQTREQTVRNEDSALPPTRWRGFDPGWMYTGMPRRGSRAGSNIWVLINTLHDGLKPLSSSDGLLVALRQLWTWSPRLALGLAIRAGAGGELEEGKRLAGLVGRGSVARLTRAGVDDLYQWLHGVLGAALADQEENPDPSGEDRRGDMRRVASAAEILSRVALRLDEGQLASMFELACKMYTSPVCQREIALHDPTSKLLKRTLDAAAPSQIRKWLPRLLDLPVAGDAGFDVAHEYIWPDPLGALPHCDLSSLTTAELAPYSQSINRLLVLAREGEAEASTRASRALVHLALSGGLIPKQIQTLVGSIWSRTTAQGYPAGIDFAPSMLLQLPERQPGEPRRAIFNHLRDAEIETREWLFFLDSATAQAGKTWRTDATTALITWTPEEASALLKKLASLWNLEKEPLIDPQKAHRFPDLPSRFCQALSRIFAPILGPCDIKAADQIRALIDEMRQRGLHTVRAWPALLVLDAAGHAMAAADVHCALLSSRRREVNDGAVALLDWLDLASANLAPSPPGWLVGAIVACSETGRQPGLTDILDVLTAILMRTKLTLEDGHLESLTRGVDRLRETMDITRMQDDGTWDDDLQVDADERVAVLAEVSKLASTLASLYSRRGAPEPMQVTTWRAFAASHPLPEVRYPWQQDARRSPPRADLGRAVLSSSPDFPPSSDTAPQSS